MSTEGPLFEELDMLVGCDQSRSLELLSNGKMVAEDEKMTSEAQLSLEHDLTQILMENNKKDLSVADSDSLFDFRENMEESTDTTRGSADMLSEPPVSSADFDLDALFFESEGMPDQRPQELDLSLEEREDAQRHQNEQTQKSDTPLTNNNKREFTPPQEEEKDDSKRRKRGSLHVPEFHFPELEGKSATELLLPENVVDPVQTLTPESSTVPSPSSPSSSGISNTALFSGSSSVPYPEISESAIHQLKSRMISAHTLLTTYTALKHTASGTSAQLQTATKQLNEANKWRFILADENARLRTRIAIVTKEKENLKSAITKLHSDTNGLKKNEVLHMEINEKNIEIARL